MTMEEYQTRRLLTIANMAAALAAGDRARLGHEPLLRPDEYAQRALVLFNAVDTQVEAETQAKYDAIVVTDEA